MQNIPVLTFHSVMDHDKNRPWSFLSTSVSVFENTLVYLKSRGYKAISLQELYDLRIAKAKDSTKLVILNFDDGFLDNYTIVFPLLKKYGFKATVFISPEFVDPRPIVRKLCYERDKKCEVSELASNWGYMSWEELKLIQSSGIIDVQGHAMTHTWYPVSSKLVDVHYEGDSFYWLWWNLHNDRKPFWLTQFKESEVIRGTPVFQFAKSLAGRRYFVNPEVENYVIEQYGKLENSNNRRQREKFVAKMNLEIRKVFSNNTGREETIEEFTDRLSYELRESKRIIEERLNKEVRYLAWPGGARNLLSMEIAESSGYQSMTSKGKPYNEVIDNPFFIYRIGGWSGLQLFGKPNCIIEKLFIRMQIHRCKGNHNLINRGLERLGKVYRAINFKSNTKLGEDNRAK